jgi:hypothetical protein
MRIPVITLICAFASLGAYGQGVLDMGNMNPIYDNVGNLLDSATGDGITVELLGGASPSSLTPIPSSTCYMNQGYFYGPGLTGLITICGAPMASSIDYAVEISSTAAGSYAGAQRSAGSYWGESDVNTCLLGYAGRRPINPPPLSFASFNANLTTPEPATIALGAMGAGALLLLRGRKHGAGGR